MADSIEWATADSDRVVVGRVASVASARVRGSSTWFRATVAISQTLKGPPAKTVDVMIRYASGESPADWKARNTELIWFLITWNRRAVRDGECRDGAPCSSEYTSAPFALRASRWGDSDAIKLDGTGRAYTWSFDVLSKRAGLIAAVKAAAPSTATQALQIDVPLDSPAGKALWGGSAVWLYVPIDAALEQRAIGWIGDADGQTRLRGVEALSHFKSAPTIRRLENLIDDPATHDVTEGDKPPVRRFYVRKRVHEVLRAWGVPHTLPPLEAPIPKP